jgi:hypothetical protein
MENMSAKEEEEEEEKEEKEEVREGYSTEKQQAPKRLYNIGGGFTLKRVVVSTIALLSAYSDAVRKICNEQMHSGMASSDQIHS